ncbi:hypothetical protein BI049_gp194 [Salmonella phage vB_SnwM_CGG4-1]|uniref:Uncharacterized protein n=1 Tax=Salmonella phage vB_SnwM_CGG4-1 TaxID=1815631 RepID=A0A1B0VVG7_9CAUD|nr:hypothetical protein BI049_gp194 [Salmonella phage vB_SnwM_CGG4-1]ANA49539.1 hypothetical protein CGG41_184 [Salmonella phage vB_SnwM_CGG4-1]
MKSILRIASTETVVENAKPDSHEFNKAAYALLQELYGMDKNFQLHPLPRFGVKEGQADNYISGVLSGNLVGEVPCAINVISDDNQISNVVGFVVFR